MELNPFSLLVFDFFRGLSKKEQNLHEKKIVNLRKYSIFFPRLNFIPFSKENEIIQKRRLELVFLFVLERDGWWITRDVMIVQG